MSESQDHSSGNTNHDSTPSSPSATFNVPGAFPEPQVSSNTVDSTADQFDFLEVKVYTVLKSFSFVDLHFVWLVFIK